MNTARPRNENKDSQTRVRGLKLVLRCDAGSDIGMGHVKRCLALAGWLEEKPVFALADTPTGVHEEIAGAGFKSVTLPQSAEARAQTIREIAPDAVVLDIAHARSRCAPADLHREIELLAKSGIPVVFIDGMNTDAVLDGELAAMLSLCVRPYPGAPAEAKGRWLTGGEYFIVSPELVRASEDRRDLAPEAKRFLITTGGGDVGALGPRAIRELNAAVSRFDIRVIVGPLVPRETRLATRRAAAESPHQINVYEDRSDLLADMQWCDLAVATTGLTKYELALNAVPSILISPDNEHEMNNRSFRDCDTAIHLGVAGALPDGAMAEACIRLAEDLTLRKRLSTRGRALIDGKGALRVLEEIKSLTDAR